MEERFLQLMEMRFHGRGGQGTVVASVLLAKAFFKAGYHVQSFPAFGVERRGAPVEAYLRIDHDKILVRTNITAPDVVLVQDRQLLKAVDVVGGLKPGGWILVNTRELGDGGDIYTGFRPACVDATHIGFANGLGTRTHPIINTAMVGALTRILGTPPLDCLESAILEHIGVEPERNRAAAVQAYENVHF